MLGLPLESWLPMTNAILRKFAAVLAILLVSTAIFAGDLPFAVPNYPPEHWCKKVSRPVGDSEVIYSGCMDLERDAYDTVKKSWNDVPRKTQVWCKKAAKSSGTGSYMLLKGCVEQETAVREENATRRFKR
jgi:hypothetical protein